MTRKPADVPADELPIDAIRVGRRYRQHMGDIAALAASIAEHGLMHPIVVTPERDLVAGERRLMAARELGWATVPVRVVTPSDLLRAEADENRVRADFTPSEAVAIAKALAPIVATPHGGDRTRGQVSTLLPGKTRDKVATAVGMSGRTLEKATAVVDAAEADPEFGDLVADMDATGKVDGAYRQLQRRTTKPADYIDLMPPAEQAWERQFRQHTGWSKGIHAAAKTLLALTPGDIVPTLDLDGREDTELVLGLIEGWVSKTRAELAKDAPLRLVGGAK